MNYEVMVAEDDERLRALLVKTLKYAGFQVFAVGTGDEALEHLNTASPQMVILDVGLPDISGLALLKKIRQRPNQRDITAIIITGNHLAEQSMEANLADLFLLKPVSVRELSAFALRFAHGAGKDVPAIEH